MVSSAQVDGIIPQSPRRKIFMRINGKIKHWNRQKAYGFITPESGEDDVFIHIRAFQNNSHKPAIGQQVTFEMSTDKRGRPCAANVTLQGEKPVASAQTNQKKFYLIGAIIILAVVAILALAGVLPI